ncbi:hypothetical protein J2Z69_001814 [Paenibacillus shirakamiensis]|uniref:Uncharacterized protein n=1 Tax=Paenibacillus shirakamiensis TaxID=1265935 RepID=A0ABS4JGE7_9BACL|nr:hypothetical protein [Paenibacillus shirakamiensis]MBP2000783.1 hypothetical protein [Paenibacillus shirakamiensis]
MYPQFQEYFKGNNVKIFLKYDGQRMDKVFTVIIVDKDNSQAKLSSNTDNPLRVFQDFIAELKIKVPDKLNTLYFNTFINMLNNLKKSIVSKLVFVLISEFIKDVEYSIFIQSSEINIDFMSNDLLKIIEVTEKIGK